MKTLTTYLIAAAAFGSLVANAGTKKHHHGKKEAAAEAACKAEKADMAGEELATCVKGKLAEKAAPAMHEAPMHEAPAAAPKAK